MHVCVCVCVCMSLCMCACVCAPAFMSASMSPKVFVYVTCVEKFNVSQFVTQYWAGDHDIHYSRWVLLFYMFACVSAEDVISLVGLPRIKKHDDLKSVGFWTEHGFGVGFGYFDGSWTSQRFLTGKGLSLEHSISGLGLTHSLESLTRSPCYCTVRAPQEDLCLWDGFCHETGAL